MLISYSISSFYLFFLFFSVATPFNILIPAHTKLTEIFFLAQEVVPCEIAGSRAVSYTSYLILTEICWFHKIHRHLSSNLTNLIFWVTWTEICLPSELSSINIENGHICVFQGLQSKPHLHKHSFLTKTTLQVQYLTPINFKSFLFQDARSISLI